LLQLCKFFPKRVYKGPETDYIDNIKRKTTMKNQEPLTKQQQQEALEAEAIRLGYKNWADYKAKQLNWDY
jgi:hypothetical protein